MRRALARAVAVALLAASPAAAHQGNPNYRSVVDSITPAVKGVTVVPASVDPKAPPQWSVVDRTARLEWHDHRMHWMSRSPPPAVKDNSKRTKVFDYAIPLQVGDQPASIRGTLFWQPDEGGGAPVGMFVEAG
jgi:hypothetical protein